MDRAIEIVKEMIEACDKELDRLSNQYAKTNPSNIYDAYYRDTLVRLKETQITRFSVLCEVRKALENINEGN